MKVAVVGATGLVGTKMLQVLAERNFPVTTLIPVASEKSVGSTILWKGQTFTVQSMQSIIQFVLGYKFSIKAESLLSLVYLQLMFPFYQ